MPLLVQCEDLQPGMRLAEAFVWRGRTMLPGGKVMTDVDVDVIRRKYPAVCLRVGDPVLDAVAQFEDDGREREAARSVGQKIAASMSEVQERVAANASLAGVNFNQAKTAVMEVIDHLQASPVSAALLDYTADAGPPLAQHTGTAFYLSVLLGLAVRDYVARERMRQTRASTLSPEIAMNLLPLGLGVMFMDVGMFPLQRVFGENYALTDEDRQAIRNHPVAGAEMLPDSLTGGVKMVVRTHHENFDGSGYPNSQPGHTLHVFTRIARLCDAFAAATGQRAYRGAKSPARAVWEMTAGPYRHCYDPVLAKVFSGLIQPFPIGAKVRLTDGRYAVVVRYNRKETCRPIVIVAFDANGDRLPPERLKGPIEAGSEPGTRLASFKGEDVSYLSDAPPPQPSAGAFSVSAYSIAPPEERAIENVLAASYP